MDQTTWLKQKAGCASASEVASASVEVQPKQFVLVTCRDLTVAENAVLNKNFPRVIVYHAGLNSSEMDVSKMAFDLLVIDARTPENHLFLEIVSDQCSALKIPILVLKKSLSNYKDLAKELDAYVLSKIEQLDGPAFFLSLVKARLPRLQSSWLTLLKKLFALLSK